MYALVTNSGLGVCSTDQISLLSRHCSGTQISELASSLLRFRLLTHYVQLEERQMMCVRDVMSEANDLTYSVQTSESQQYDATEKQNH